MTADDRLLQCRHLTDTDNPYVWTLRLSEQEFHNLEEAIYESVSAHNGSMEHLIDARFALHTVTYIAEWYKRKYRNGASFPLGAINYHKKLEALWDSAGIDKDRFVYRRESDGHHIWQYSLYVLGGVALNFEMSKSARVRNSFLKGLCRLLHNQDDGDDKFASEDRAIAFCESMKYGHSIYHYIHALVDGDAVNSPFDDEELSNPESLEAKFLKAVQEADANALNEKFRYEWIIYHDERVPYMQRKLRVHLRPEADGMYHDYLLHHRLLNQWGVNASEHMRKIFLYLRFKDGERIVQEIDTEHPLMTFANTGDYNTGLHVCDHRDYADCIRIPSVRFDRFEVVACDAEDKELATLQTESMPDYMQLWQSEDCSCYWSNKQSRRRETAVVFNDNWRCESSIDDRKPFKNKAGQLSESWNWKYIYNRVDLINVHNTERVPFFNLKGDIQIEIKQYPEVLLYDEPAMVKRTVENYEDASIEESMLTLVFRKEDIKVRKISHSDGLGPQVEEVTPEEILIKSLDDNRAQYKDWTECEKGARKLKFIIREAEYIMQVYILPSLLDKGQELPIKRDCEECSIEFLDFDSNVQTLQDNVVANYIPIEPTLKVKIGEITDQYEDFVTLNIIRPTRIKEIYLDGKIKRYNDGHEFRLPFLLKDRVMICDFSDSGYQRFDCGQLQNIYGYIGNGRNAASAYWSEGRMIKATELCKSAPEWLYAWLGEASSANPVKDNNFFLWVHNEQKEQPTSYFTDVPDASTLFFSMREIDNDFHCYFGKRGDLDVDIFDVFDNIQNENPTDSVLTAFKLAQKHNIYFFTFTPINDAIYDGAQKQEIYDKLKQSSLQSDDKRCLLRLSEEFLFDWKDILSDEEYNEMINDK